MVKALLRCPMRLVLILALAVAGHAAGMPMAVATTGAAMAGMVDDLGAGPCRNCPPAERAGLDCGPLCAPAAVIVPAAPPPFVIACPQPWTWSDEAACGGGIEPETGPPRP